MAFTYPTNFTLGPSSPLPVFFQLSMINTELSVSGTHRDLSHLKPFTQLFSLSGRMLLLSSSLLLLTCPFQTGWSLLLYYPNSTLHHSLSNYILIQHLMSVTALLGDEPKKGRDHVYLLHSRFLCT